MTENDRNRLAEITLEEDPGLRLSRDLEQERAIAVYDIVRENSFAVEGVDRGPYRMNIASRENRLIFHISDMDGDPVEEAVFPVGALRSLIRDYFQVCDSYFEAVKTASPSKIEAIDMGRRGLHNDGAEILRTRLAPAIRIDEITGRGLFTLICVLHPRGPRT